jgi:hypothetical protein
MKKIKKIENTNLEDDILEHEKEINSCKEK